MMNPSPTEIVELFPGVTPSSVKPKPKKVNRAEVTPEEPSKEEAQVNAATPTTPKPKARGAIQTSLAKVEKKPPETKKGGKGGGKGKRGKSEPRPEKRKQQCIPFFRGACQKGDQCRYEHQVGEDGRPVPVGLEILQAVKQYNESKIQAQAKTKAAPRGGVTASMIVLEPDDLEHGIVVSATQALDDDQYYAMVDSGTNAVIVPLHPGMKGEIAECQVPSATVTGPIVQVYSHNGAKRLVVALLNSAILVAQE